MNKGRRQQDAGGQGPLDLIEQKFVQAVGHYVPNLVHEAENLLSAAAKGVVQLHAKYGGVRLRLMAADGVAIDGMHIPATAAPPGGQGGGGGGGGGGGQRCRACMIVVNGNAEFYELDGLSQSAYSNAARYRQMGLDVVLFNYRGVGISEGSPSRSGLVLDVHAAVDFAIRPRPEGLGVPADRIVVCGRSLGGAIGTIVCAELKHHPLILCNTRSFSTLGRAAHLLLEAQYGERVGKAANTGIWFLGWELDALAAWRQLTGYKWFESVSDDDIILQGAKLSDALVEGDGGENRVGSDAGTLRRINMTPGRGSGHNRALLADEYRQRWAYMREALMQATLPAPGAAAGRRKED